MKTIIQISGLKRTGKDTLADVLVEKHGYTKMSFAEPLKEFVLDLFTVRNPKTLDKDKLLTTPVFAFKDKEHVQRHIIGAINYHFGNIEEKKLFAIVDKIMDEFCIEPTNYINEPDLDNEEFLHKKFVLSTLAYRHALQYIGTEILRKEIGEDVWVNLMKERIALSKSNKIVIPDTRFANEDLSKWGLVNAFAKVYKVCLCREGRLREYHLPNHSSEVDHRNIKFDFTDLSIPTFKTSFFRNRYYKKMAKKLFKKAELDKKI